jgi:DNA polymerase III alpha subunit
VSDPIKKVLLRRAMGGKRSSEKMRALMARVFEGAAATGVPK